jgi:hypothetical protein
MPYEIYKALVNFWYSRKIPESSKFSNGSSFLCVAGQWHGMRLKQRNSLMLCRQLQLQLIAI